MSIYASLTDRRCLLVVLIFLTGIYIVFGVTAYMLHKQYSKPMAPYSLTVDIDPIDWEVAK